MQKFKILEDNYVMMGLRLIRLPVWKKNLQKFIGRFTIEKENHHEAKKWIPDDFLKGDTNSKGFMSKQWKRMNAVTEIKKRWIFHHLWKMLLL